MKRIILATVAALIAAAPAAEAAAQRHAGPELRHGQRFDPPAAKADSGHAVRKTVKKAPGWQQAKRPHWSKGKRLPDWQRHHAVRDHHRHGLRRPAWGEQWVRIGGDYLLIDLRSGVIRLIVGR